ncbi:hypothetical protein JQN64_26090, partial [Escherichia coli]|nr:hypothetical protein [Escherichia coli]
IPFSHHTHTRSVIYVFKLAEHERNKHPPHTIHIFRFHRLRTALTYTHNVNIKFYTSIDLVQVI